MSDAGTIRAFTSTMGPPFSERKAGPPPAPQSLRHALGQVNEEGRNLSVGMVLGRSDREMQPCPRILSLAASGSGRDRVDLVQREPERESHDLKESWTCR